MWWIDNLFQNLNKVYQVTGIRNKIELISEFTLFMVSTCSMLCKSCLFMSGYILFTQVVIYWYRLRDLIYWIPTKNIETGSLSRLN